MPEVICIGEAMVMLVPNDARPLRAHSNVALRVGGAESNAATSLAGLGHHVQWVSAVGDDPFGRIILEDLAAHGVDVESVRVDASAPTGLSLKDPGEKSTEVHYYRAGSAASRLRTQDIDANIASTASIIHLSGITPALGASSRDLVNDAILNRHFGDAKISFDVNFRRRLWHRADAAPALAALAARSDIVFVGRDEAEELWGTPTARDVRKLLPEPEYLIVKDGALEATVFGPDGVATEPARAVKVVEQVGAGNAFAAGWLSGYLRGYEPVRALRLGHLLASSAVQIIGDCPPAPSAAEIDSLAQMETIG